MVNGERPFQHAAPNDWNQLPLVIVRESPSLVSFKTRLKYIFVPTRKKGYCARKKTNFVQLAPSVNLIQNLDI